MIPVEVHNSVAALTITGTSSIVYKISWTAKNSMSVVFPLSFPVDISTRTSITYIIFSLFSNSTENKLVLIIVTNSVESNLEFSTVPTVARQAIRSQNEITILNVNYFSFQ